MASNLACIGLSFEDRQDLESLIALILPLAEPFGRADGVDLLRWEDPNSGARLVMGVHGGTVVELIPSLASPPSTRLAAVQRANDDVTLAAVVDGHGEQMTILTFELEQRRLLRGRAIKTGMAALVGFGQGMSVHLDAAAFAASPDSLVFKVSDPGEAPELFDEEGWEWPPRFGAESFLSPGFADPEHADAGALLTGTVLSSERRTNERSGQAFIVTHVRTSGFECAVCLSVDEHPREPHPGEVLSGLVSMVGSMPSLEEPPRTRRWWRRSGA
jgi:hypothetical protein